MNRCFSFSSLPVLPRKARANIASFAACALLAAAAFLPALTAAQPAAPLASATQNEAAAGGRQFPAGALRGRLVVTAWPEVSLDGRPARLAPGARIFSAQRMLVAPASITGQPLLVNYTRDAGGQLREVWILTPEEAAAKRATASDKPAAPNPPASYGTPSY